MISWFHQFSCLLPLLREMTQCDVLQYFQVGRNNELYRFAYLVACHSVDCIDIFDLQPTTQGQMDPQLLWLSSAPQITDHGSRHGEFRAFDSDKVRPFKGIDFLWCWWVLGRVAESLLASKDLQIWHVACIIMYPRHKPDSKLTFPRWNQFETHSVPGHWKERVGLLPSPYAINNRKEATVASPEPWEFYVCCSDMWCFCWLGPF